MSDDRLPHSSQGTPHEDDASGIWPVLSPEARYEAALAWDDSEDPQGDPEANYRYVRHQLASERSNIRALTQALGEHLDLQRDISFCHADFVILTEQDRTHGSSASVFTNLAAIWLWRRYRALWKRFDDDFSVPDVLLMGAIKTSVTRDWADAVRELDTAPVAMALHNPDVRVDVFPDAASFRDTWRQLPAADPRKPPSVIVVQIPYGAQSEELDRAFQWARRRARSLHERPKPGSRKQKHPADYSYNVRVYNFWRTHPAKIKKRPDLWRGQTTVTWKEFADLIFKQAEEDNARAQQTNLPTPWPNSMINDVVVDEDTIRIHVTDLLWLAPEVPSHVPSTLRDAILTNEILTDDMRTIFAQYLSRPTAVSGD